MTAVPAVLAEPLPPECVERHLVVIVCGAHTRDEQGLGVPSQAVLQQPRELAVAVRYVAPLLALSKSIDDVAQLQQALVDVDALVEAIT